MLSRRRWRPPRLRGDGGRRSRPDPLVTGTGTGVGKTVVTAAVAALRSGPGRRVKPAQTGVAAGEPGDLAEVARLAAASPTSRARPLPRPARPGHGRPPRRRPALDPAAAARPPACSPPTTTSCWSRARAACSSGSTDDGGTLADVAATLAAPVLVVATAGLGTLNHTALTVEALRAPRADLRRNRDRRWPADPDLAALRNLRDLPPSPACRCSAPLAGRGGRARTGRVRRASRVTDSGPRWAARWQTPEP